MTNVELVAKIKNGSCLLGEGIILKPDGSVVDADGRQLMPPDEIRAGMYTTTAAEKAVMNGIPAAVGEIEESVGEIEESVSALNDAVNSKCADIVIKLDKSLYSTLADSDLHLISGSYSDANEKLTQGIPLTALVYSYHIEGTEHIMNVYPTAITAYTGYSEYILILALDGSGEYHAFYLSESGLSVTQPE